MSFLNMKDVEILPCVLRFQCNIFKKHGLKPSIVLEDVVPSGLNILRSNNKQQDEEVLKLGKIELAVNINSCEDIVVLEEVLSYIGLKI